jgi:hypothetical protein
MRGIRRRIVQSTARIDRIMINAPICRTFLRAVLLWVLDPQGMVTDRHDKYRLRTTRVGVWCFAGLLSLCGMPRSIRAMF